MTAILPPLLECTTSHEDPNDTTCSNSNSIIRSTSATMNRPLACFVQNLLLDCHHRDISSNSSSSNAKAEEGGPQKIAFEIVQDNCPRLSERARHLIHMSYNNNNNPNNKGTSMESSSSRWDTCEVVSPKAQSQSRRSRVARRSCETNQIKTKQPPLPADTTVAPVNTIQKRSNKPLVRPCRRASIDLWPLQQQQHNKRQQQQPTTSKDAAPCLPPRCPMERSKLKWRFALDDDVLEELTSGSSSCSSSTDNDDDDHDSSSCDSETTYSEVCFGNDVDWSVASSDSEWDSDDSSSDDDDDDNSSESCWEEEDPLCRSRTYCPTTVPSSNHNRQNPNMNDRPHDWVLPQNQILPNIQSLIHQAAMDPSMDIHQRIQQALMLSQTITTTAETP